MKITKSQVTMLKLTDLDSLDPVSVLLEDFGPSRGKITITCFGKAWTAYWGGIGDQTISEFFISCDEHYIAKNLSTIDSEIYDIDAVQADAEKKGIDCYRDDPWYDYGFMNEMYGPDMMDWGSSLPKMKNPEYSYLCRIIKTVQEALKTNG